MDSTTDFWQLQILEGTALATKPLQIDAAEYLRRVGCRWVRLFFVDGPRGFCQRHGKSYLTRRRRGGEGGGGGLLTGRAIPSAYRWAWCPAGTPCRGSPSTHRGRGWLRSTRSFRTASAPTQLGAALLRRRPKGLLPAARQELLDPSKAWWGGRRGRLADRPRYSISVSLGVVPRWYSRVVEVPVRIEVAAGFVAPGASEPPRLQPSWPPGGFGPAHG